MPGTVIGTKLNYGYPGQISRHGDEVSRTFPVKEGEILFGEAVALNDDGTVQAFGATHDATKFCGAAGHTQWDKKTPQEILKDINDAIVDGWANSQYDQKAVPNHILVPPKQYAYLVNTMISIAGVNGAISLLEYLKQNNIAKDKGVDLLIGDCRWCAKAGTSGNDRMVCYVNDDYFVDMDMPVSLGRVMTQPNINNASYDSLYAANVGVVKVHYTEPFIYRDGI